MKRLLIGALLYVVSALPGFAQEAVLGLWKTAVDDGAYAYVDIHMCGDNVCGTIMRTFNAEGEYQSPNIGRDIIINMVPRGNGKYAGKVWRPSNDKVYVGKLVLNGDQLSMKGCVAGGLICKSSLWTRIE